MEQWPFVVAAYSLTAAGTIFVLIQSIVAMRAAESALEQLNEQTRSMEDG